MMKANTEERSRYLPALKWHTLSLLFYDFICFVSRLDKKFKNEIIDYAQLNGAETILDIGCNNCSFLEIACAHFPQITAFGVDPDPYALSRGRHRILPFAKRASCYQSLAQQLPLNTASVDVVFCTLTLHHLSDRDKYLAMNQVYRVLKPGGSFIIADYGKRSVRPALYLFENKAYLKSRLEGHMSYMLEKSGFYISRQKIYEPFRGKNMMIWVAKKSAAL